MARGKGGPTPEEGPDRGYVNERLGDERVKIDLQLIKEERERNNSPNQAGGSRAPREA